MAASPKSFVQFPFQILADKIFRERGDPVRFVDSTFEAKVMVFFVA